MPTESKVRVDKWLWSVRIFKSRTQATDACKSGKVKINDGNIKASSTVEIGDHVSVRKNGFHLQLNVLELIKKRVGAPIAITCYETLTPEEEMNKFQNWYIGKGKIENREKGIGRPTKKDRRRIDEFKDDQF
ncbi:MAG: RNA-binding S4 domain-containing protein [Saprospiraceae bacterium]|nr:RNA-binding S4 domain-containing protein [Saprospiraceae bacterium]